MPDTYSSNCSDATQQWYFDGLVEDCSNTSALAMKLLKSCTKPSISRGVYFIDDKKYFWNSEQ